MGSEFFTRVNKHVGTLEEEIQTRFGHGKVNQDDYVSCDLALGSFALRTSERPTHDAANRVSEIRETGGTKTIGHARGAESADLEG